MSRRVLVHIGFVLAASSLLYGWRASAGQRDSSTGRWVTAWGTAQQGLGTAPISNATVRVVARVTIGGEAVRIRLDNTYGTTPVTVSKAYVGWRRADAAVVPGSNRPVIFSGQASVVLPAGGSVVSDAVTLLVRPRQDLAVSLHIAGSEIRPSQHANAYVNSFMTTNNTGDLAADEEGRAFTTKFVSAPWLKSIDVMSRTPASAIVAFGDSITDGTCAAPDASERWADWLSWRLDLNGMNMAVVNEGIGGNTVLAKHPDPVPPGGMAAPDRLDRDVLSHHGVTHVIVFLGTNDLRRSATAPMVKEGLEELVRRIRAKGLKVIGATAIARANNQAQLPWDAGKTRQRNELNEWVRRKGSFDAVIDFDAAMRNSENPDLPNPALDCDGIHPNRLGYYVMGKSIRLDLFKPGGR